MDRDIPNDRFVDSCHSTANCHQDRIRHIHSNTAEKKITDKQSRKFISREQDSDLNLQDVNRIARKALLS